MRRYERSSPGEASHAQWMQALIFLSADEKIFQTRNRATTLARPGHGAYLKAMAIGLMPHRGLCALWLVVCAGCSSGASGGSSGGGTQAGSGASSGGVGPGAPGGAKADDVQPGSSG